MTGFDVFKVIGTITTIVRTINALKDSNNSTAEDLFKESCIEAVKQSAPNFAYITDPAEVDVDSDTLVTLLKDIDISALMLLEENAVLSEIAAIFAKCIILPGHQLTTVDLERKLQPIIKKTFAIFLERLPRNQQATNEMMLEFDRAQLVNQEHLKDSTDEIRKTTQTTHDAILGLDAKVTDLSNRHLDISTSTAVEAALEKEHQSAIDNAKDLLRKNKPQSSIDSLENLKQRIWTNASPTVKFSILTNIAEAMFVLNKEQEGAMLVLEAFQYNPEDERALSNRALAHASLGETEDAEKYAKKALEKNPANIHAHATLVEISTDEETLEDVIAKVPEYLREKPQIAYAISSVAKHRKNLEEARKWREAMVTSNHEDPDFKAALAAILIEQVIEDTLAVYTKQLGNSQREQLTQVVQLLTEAWDCVINTELHAIRIDWIINRSTAYYLLGEWKNAIKDLDAALEIEPAHSLLLKNRAILAFEHGEKESAIEFLEKIQSGPEASEAPILITIILFSDERFDEAITTLNNFLQTSPSRESQEKANRWLVRIYIADKRFEEAERVSKVMQESSPRHILNLTEAAQISSATGKLDEACSQLKEAYNHAQNKEAYNYAQNSEEFLEIAELADQLYIHELFKEASVLYEKSRTQV